MSTTAAKTKLAAVESRSARANDVLAWLSEYQRKAEQTDQNPRCGMEGLAFPLLGLFGEVGTLLSALKKKRRDKESYVGYSDAVLEEFGDVLWYLSNVASRTSLSLAELSDESSFGCASPNPYDTNRSEAADSPEFEAALIALAGRAGLLLNEFSSGRTEDNQKVIAAHLRDILAALIYAAGVANVDLRDAAQNNIRKINSRWPRTRHYLPLFDEHFDTREQLPRRIEMHIVETKVASKTYVIQLCNGVEIGSRLTDNKLIEDDYRFHDVFHLAYAGILGWSPCLRALLKVKRKSQAEIDEAEDGARAALIEEGVATMIFQHALRLNYFSSIQSLDYPLLKSVRDFVSGYEVDQCPLWQWEKAILDGFEVFRKLRMHRRGIVAADLLERSITFKPHPNDR